MSFLCNFQVTHILTRPDNDERAFIKQKLDTICAKSLQMHTCTSIYYMPRWHTCIPPMLRKEPSLPLCALIYIAQATNAKPKACTPLRGAHKCICENSETQAKS